jgi:hypothetical protein
MDQVTKNVERRNKDMGRKYGRIDMNLNLRYTLDFSKRTRSNRNRRRREEEFVSLK